MHFCHHLDIIFVYFFSVFSIHLTSCFLHVINTIISHSRFILLAFRYRLSMLKWNACCAHSKCRIEKWLRNIFLNTLNKRWIHSREMERSSLRIQSMAVWCVNCIYASNSGELQWMQKRTQETIKSQMTFFSLCLHLRLFFLKIKCFFPSRTYTLLFFHLLWTASHTFQFYSAAFISNRFNFNNRFRLLWFVTSANVALQYRYIFSFFLPFFSSCQNSFHTLKIDSLPDPLLLNTAIFLNCTFLLPLSNNIATFVNANFMRLEN